MKTLFFFFFFFVAGSSFAEDPVDWLQKNFPCSEIAVKPLSGGLSGVAMYKVEIDGKPYVLRLHRDATLQDQRERYALTEAAKRKISPEIAAISEKAILMEFIQDKTLSIDQAKEEQVLKKIAETAFIAHQMPSHEYEGESLLSKAERCTQVVLSYGIGSEEDIRGALALVKKYRSELDEYDYQTVNVHGDLNPRNIFFTKGKVLLIDWAESNREDPFYDLAYFSLKHDYNAEREKMLLAAYLKRAPNDEELARFDLQKKIHQAFWSLTNLYLAKAELNKHPDQKIDPCAPLECWSSYQKAYAESCSLSAQYFYDLSRLNYQMAK